MLDVERKAHSTGRWLRPHTVDRGPRVVVAVVCEMLPPSTTISTGHDVSAAQVFHLAESHISHHHWSHPTYKSFFSGDDLHEWIETQTSIHRKVHVFTPNVTGTMTLSRFWERIEERGCQLGGKEKSGERGEHREEPPLAPVRPNFNSATLAAGPSIGGYRFSTIHVGQPTEILRYRVNGRSVEWCNNSQFIEDDEDKIATALNYAHLPASDAWTSPAARKRPDDERAFLWCRFFTKLADWWVKHKSGPWGASVAACAAAWLRRRLSEKTILKHNNERVGHLEAHAIFGGRRSVWFVGNVGTVEAWEPYRLVAPARSPWGTLDAGMHHHDIRSMYPYLLARCKFPVKLLTYKRTMTNEAAMDYLDDFGLIASVLVHTTTPDYPTRTAHGIRYPIGRFWTTLAGPELACALSSGHVERISHAAVYEMGRPFKSVAEEMLTLRTKYRDQEEPVWELFAKTLANSMSGRMALRHFTWQNRPKVKAKYQWGTWVRRLVDTDESIHFRALAGMVQERVEEEGAPRDMGAAYAYLTSYGRWLMAWVRAMCPEGSVLAQDTDGVWTTPAATAELYRSADAESRIVGTLHCDHMTNVGRFFGAQHYWWGKHWVLSGHARPNVTPGTTIAKSVESSVPLFHTQAAPEPFVYTREVEREIGRIQAHGGISEDGWVKPFYALVAADAPEPELTAHAGRRL